MQAMTEREAGHRLCGIVQIDDTYLGGERKGGKAERDSENKVPFVIAVETTDEGHPRQALITPLSGFTRVALAEWRSATFVRKPTSTAMGLALSAP